MKFGVQSPNCLAGMMYPVPFATAKDVVDIGVEAEQLGYYDVGGNDHLSTQQYVRDAWPAPPDYFEPLVTLSNIAARTSVLRLTTGILVLPMRQPVLAAKQIATLDNLSGGRLMVGAAVGGYRDEFEAVCPDLKDASRAELTDEGMRALRVLFDDARASFRGKHFHFEDVESFPKPIQMPFPIYSGGNSDGSLRRAAELCQGWLPSKLGPDQVRQKRAVLDGYARAAGRDPAQITTALGLVVCIGDTPEQAREILENSAFGLFRTSLEKTTTKGVDMDRYADINLVGTPAQVCEKVAAFEAAGVEHLCCLEFVGNTVEEMARQIRRLARDVIPAFPDRARHDTARRARPPRAAAEYGHLERRAVLSRRPREGMIALGTSKAALSSFARFVARERHFTLQRSPMPLSRPASPVGGQLLEEARELRVPKRMQRGSGLCRQAISLDLHPRGADVAVPIRIHWRVDDPLEAMREF